MAEPVDRAAVMEQLEKWREAAAAVVVALDAVDPLGARLLAKHGVSEQELSWLSHQLAAIARACEQARDDAAVDAKREPQ